MAGEPLTTAEQAKIDELFALMNSDNYYRLLGLDPGTSEKDLQRAYYAMSREWHPDRFFRREMGEYGDRLDIVFAGITKAYKTLSNEETRREYDHDYLRNLRQTTNSQELDDQLRSSRTPVIYFWYRQSPWPLVPPSSDLLVTQHQPPFATPGMARVSIWLGKST